MPKISIIIPVYKAEKYLYSCLDSILPQTFTDFEVLLIDDGSPDRSGEICEEYAKKDARIRVFHKENGGVSSARNVGLREAKGDWIMFIDSDDTVDADYIEHYYLFVKDDVQLVLGRIDIPQKEIIHQKESVVRSLELVHFVIEHKVLNYSAPFCKIFNRQIIVDNDILFPMGVHMGEDGIFLTRYLNSINTLKAIDYSGYNYNRHTASLSQRYYAFREEWECYVLWKAEVERFVELYLDDNPRMNKMECVWSLRIGETFHRCLQAIYRYTEAHLSMREQIQLLKSIPDKDAQEYDLYFKPLNAYNSMYKWLFVHKFFIPYVIMGRVDKIVRRCYKKEG